MFPRAAQPGEDALLISCRIVQPVNPVVLKNLCHELDVMGTLLGHAHDLSFLRARLLTGAGKATWQRQAEELGGCSRDERRGFAVQGA